LLAEHSGTSRGFVQIVAVVGRCAAVIEGLKCQAHLTSMMVNMRVSKGAMHGVKETECIKDQQYDELQIKCQRASAKWAVRIIRMTQLVF
jgi:hypothetical protein